MRQEPQDDAALTRDIALLTQILDEAVDEVAGSEPLALVRRLRTEAIALRKGELPGGRGAFHASIGALTTDELALVARAFTHWFHLVNAAEEQHRIRLLRRHNAEKPASDSLAEVLATYKAAGLDAEAVRKDLGRLFVMPVLTAHPTESRRRTLRDHLDTLKRAVDSLETVRGPDGLLALQEELKSTVVSLFATEESRATKPSPRDELEASIDVFERTLFDATPAFYRAVETALARAYPEEDWVGLGGRDASQWAVPSFLRWGTWIGGDRDGNPFITAHVTRTVLERMRGSVLNRHLRDVDSLGRSLSISARRTTPNLSLDELEASLLRDRERFPELAARVQRFTVFEPFREKLWYIGARLRATRDRTDQAYVDVGGYQRDLALLERALVGSGFARLATGPLRDARRRADVFGFHGASLDLRQHSGVHERVVAELMQALRILPPEKGYLGLDEAARVDLLHAVLARPASLAPAHRTNLSTETQDLLATLDMVGRARREQGALAAERYIVSFTSTLSDLLEVLFLQRAASLAPGELRPVPLLEQIEDLAQAGPLSTAMLASPPIRAAIGDELEVMLGYSDSCKQAGYVASQVALRKAQLALADVADAHGVLLTVFHGRGGAIGRGGGPAHRAIRAQPERALRGRLRVTEQGETINARYARREIAMRDLEQVVSAVLHAGLAERTPPNSAELGMRGEVFERASTASYEAYHALLSPPERISRYAQAATPINEVTALPIGSRPSSRKRGLSLSDLRAIPWVFSWNQSRHGLPGWFGLGTALAVLSRDLGVEEVRKLYSDSAFFRALINNAELALTRADIDVAALYAALADPDAAGLFDAIRAEWDRTVQGVLGVVDKQRILGNRPHLLATVERRNPFVDVLSHTQVALKERLSACQDDGEREELARALSTTVHGIAAGLQSAG
jgi:phosphoenolpyruvate carboxylase